MKNKILAVLVLLVMSLPSVFAANVDIYPSYVIVKDTWEANIQQGQNANVEWTLPENVDVSSFSILNPDIDILSRLEAVENGSLIGRSVTVWTTNNKYTGIVKSDEIQLVLVSPRNGEPVAIINPLQVVAIVPDTQQTIANTLKLEVQNKGSEALDKLDVRYFASGITWGIKYVLQINGKEAVLNGEYQIENATNTELKDATIRLIAKNQSSPYLYKAQDVSLNYAMSAREAAPSVEHQAETAVYTIPEKVTIPANSRLRLRLLKEENLAVEKVYRMNNDMISVELSLKGITQALPAGDLQIFDGDILSSSQYLSSKPESGELILNLGQTLDIAGKREQVNYKSIDDVYTSDYKVTLKNNKPEKVAVEVVVNLPRENAELSSDFGTIRRVSSYSAVIDVELDESSEKTFNCTVKYVND